MEQKEQSNGELSTDMAGLWQKNNEAIEGPINESLPFNTTMGKNSQAEVEHNSSNGKYLIADKYILCYITIN